MRLTTMGRRIVLSYSFLLILAVAVPVLGQAKSPAHLTHRFCFPPNPNINPLFFGEIKLNYSAPTTAATNIYGGAVPFGRVWQMGGDVATTFETNTTLLVGTQQLPASSYTLFAIPEQNYWTLVFSKKLGEGKIPYPGPADDQLRVEMQISSLTQPVSEFTISFDTTTAGCVMNVDWETTRASVTFRAKSSDPPPGPILKTHPK
jgi:hypothetical protein